MRTPRSPFRMVVSVVSTAAVLGLSLPSCSRSSAELAEPTSSEGATTTTVADTAGTSIFEPVEPAPPSGSPAPTTDLSGPEPTTSGVSVASIVTITVAELPEVGVPGLDSADAFCASWSRFAGSFQVVAVTAAFGSGPPEQLASLEVAASPVVTEAYDDLLANWPDELSSEAGLVADEFLGPFARRLQVARESLDAVGADPAMIDTITEAWVDGLAGRDPSTPEFTVDLPDEAWSVIDAAAGDFSTRLVPFGSDPSLVTDVDTPLTNEYLAVSCPDQGTLSGQEIDSP